MGKTLFWARLRKDVGTRAALEWWLGSAATEEQIANWKKAHRALMPGAPDRARLQSGEYEAVGWEVENGGDSAVRRACWYMAGMLPYTADWGESWELYCQKWQDHAHDVLRLLTFPGDMLHLTAQAEIGQPRRVRDLYYWAKFGGDVGNTRRCRAASDCGAPDRRAGPGSYGKKKIANISRSARKKRRNTIGAIPWNEFKNM